FLYKAIPMFLLQCAELMAGKAHIPRLTMIRTASKLSTYSMAIMDGKRNRITKEDLCDHAWEYRFTIVSFLNLSSFCMF
uniref:Uncharacterized protein n=1 Tax=Aegilops tauschii subsp. strangulata TaxID=200361 RepID=A0A452YCA0_AEGTS